MDPDVANFGVVMVIIVVVVAALASITVRFIRNIKPQSRNEPPSPLYEQRMDQLQQSVDAIAVEVERIAEAQRFSAKLLAERSEAPALPR
jgi:aspartokinase